MFKSVLMETKSRVKYMLKDNVSTEQAAENVLRSYLNRCFSEVSKQYPQVSSMNPEDGVEELLKLRRNRKLIIELNTVRNRINCTIQHIN